MHVTAVVPRAKVLPDAGAQDTDTDPSTKSVAVGEVYVTVAPSAEAASIVTFVGVVNDGAVVSTTTTLKVVGVAALLCASVAVQVTAVVPRAKVLPDAGVQEAAKEPSTASTAVGAVYVTAAPEALVASTETAACVAITGAVVS